MNPRLPVPLDLADEPIARSVLALQRASYAVEAELIGSDGIPHLTETLAELRAAGLEWLGAFDERAWSARVSWARPGRRRRSTSIDLVVAPRAFRRGVASALLDGLDAPSRVIRRWSRPAARTDRPSSSTAGAASRLFASAKSSRGRGHGARARRPRRGR